MAANDTETPKVALLLLEEALSVEYTEDLIGKKQRRHYLLGKEYKAYRATIRSDYPNPILLSSVNIPAKVSPEAAYGNLKKSPASQYLTTAAVGLAFAPFSFGITLVTHCFILGPLMAVPTGSYNKKTREYVNQFQGSIEQDVIHPNEELALGILIPVEIDSPQLQLTIQDLDTQEIKVVNL